MKVFIGLLAILTVVIAKPQCKSSDQNTLWPDYDNKAYFYQCIGTGRSYRMPCSQDTWFSFQKQACVEQSEWKPPPPNPEVTEKPTNKPDPTNPSTKPTIKPTEKPTIKPTEKPHPPTPEPTKAPTKPPTNPPTNPPTKPTTEYDGPPTPRPTKHPLPPTPPPSAPTIAPTIPPNPNPKPTLPPNPPTPKPTSKPEPPQPEKPENQDTNLKPDESPKREVPIKTHDDTKKVPKRRKLKVKSVPTKSQ